MSRNRPKGFTLLELLLALAIVSMVTMSLYASMRIAFKARGSAAAAVAPVRTAQVAMDLIRQDLENALPPTGTLAGPFVGQPAGTFGSTSDTLEFYGMTNASPAGRTDPIEAGGIAQINLELDTPDGSRDAQPALVRRIARNLLAQQEEEPAVEVLCRNVVSLTFRYFDGSSWLDTWDSTQEDNTLPVAVAVTLEIAVPVQGASESRIYLADRIFMLSGHADSGSTDAAGGGQP